MPLHDKRVTAFIGPSGCGKSHASSRSQPNLRALPWAASSREVIIDGENILSPRVDLNLLRARIGMVFQKPTPFPMSIYDNIAYGIRLYERLPPSRARRAGRIGTAPRGALGRGQRQAATERARAFGGTAATAVHRARGCSPAGDPAARRARLRVGPSLHPADRGADCRAEKPTIVLR